MDNLSGEGFSIILEHMQNWERAVTGTSHMSRLYLGYCLENELNQKHNFVLNTVCFYWLPVALRCHFRWRHISSIECGGSGSSFGGVCIHSRLYSTKATWFPLCLLLLSSDTATNARSLGSIIECPCMRIGFMGSCVPMNARDLGSSLGVCTCA